MKHPLRDGVRYLTDSGLETTLVFADKMNLPSFAAFPLLDDEKGRARLERRYYREHADLAREAGMGFVFEAPTWRASPDWGRTVGYAPGDIARINREAIAFCRALAADYGDIPTAVSGQIGPRGDGYVPDRAMSAEEAEAYHAFQMVAFDGPDMVTALTINTVAEAIGIVRAARTLELPVVISFTLETDGRLATGETLAHAIAETDIATGSCAVHFMINCAHPDHFAPALDGAVARRVRGLRANASRLSHAELDAMEVLDAGDPVALGGSYAALAGDLPGLQVVGGCCGTDIRHMREIVRQQGAPAPA